MIPRRAASELLRAWFNETSGFFEGYELILETTPKAALEAAFRNTNNPLLLGILRQADFVNFVSLHRETPYRTLASNVAYPKTSHHMAIKYLV
jgi:hypothetical protein